MKPTYIILCAFLSFSAQWVNGDGPPSNSVSPRGQVTVIDRTTSRPIRFNNLLQSASRCVRPIVYEDCLPKEPSPIRVCVELESSLLNNFEIVYTCVRVRLSDNFKLDLPCVYIDQANATVLTREEVYSTIQESANIEICEDPEERFLLPSSISATLALAKSK